MTLTRLIEKANESPELERLAREAAASPQAAFVSASLRPFVVAALLQSDEFTGRPALVVAGDDRAARDLAADLRAFLGPRVRFYPARGVRYESHLAPPPHLVGLRVAALDALTEDAPAVVVASAVALMERVPDPELRPHGFTLRVDEEIDLEETLERLVELGYER
jgi:transcription-repair coupling factor (superfamily II helicase)